MDAAGMLLLGGGLLAGMFAATEMGERGVHPWSALFLAPIVVAVLALVVFFHHIGRATHPFIAPRLIHGPGFGPVNLVNALYGGVTFGVITLVPLYATNRYGISALDSGTLLTAQGLAAIVLSIVGALALRRTGHRPPMYAGSVAIIVGIFLLTIRAPAGISPYAWLAGSTFLIGAGGGAINPPSRNAGLQLAPQHSAMLAALRTMSMQVGSIVMISVATAVLTSSANPGVQAWVYLASGLLLVLTLPLIAHIPEHRGSW